MPELPEVQTTVNGLRRVLPGQKILNVWTDLNTKDKRKRDTVANPKYFSGFRKKIIGKKIISVTRRAKNILINISGEQIILVHMKMTGHLLYDHCDHGNRFIHVIFTLSGGKRLAFCDARKFGKITLINAGELDTSKHLRGLGPEPLEKSFDLHKFIQVLRRRPGAPVKTALIDQSIIAGIGNIYSDEILWLSEIHPLRQVSSLTQEELKSIFTSSKKILKRALEARGTSDSDYRDPYGKKGHYQDILYVYGLEGEKCQKKNGGIIARLKIGGRSAHFCPIHQKL